MIKIHFNNRTDRQYTVVKVSDEGGGQKLS